eukprot:2776973-Amphidinium_carterae.1
MQHELQTWERGLITGDERLHQVMARLSRLGRCKDINSAPNGGIPDITSKRQSGVPIKVWHAYSQCSRGESPIQHGDKGIGVGTMLGRH